MTENRKKKAIDRSQLHTVEIQKEQPAAQQKPANRSKKQITQQKKYSGKGKFILITVVVVILFFLTVFKIYVDNDYEALQSMENYQSMASLEIESSDNVIAIEDLDTIAGKETIGFIIYGDERVQRECYLPLMIALSNQGYCVYLPTTFGNLPVLNQEGAEYVIRTYTRVENWYIIAHGKACPVAARYAKKHADKIKGLIYLGGASYHTDLSHLELPLLSIKGSLDTIVDAEATQNAQVNDPAGAQYLIIDGGNHTGFADTFLMRKDTAASISTAEQINQTVDAITAFLQQIEEF